MYLNMIELRNMCELKETTLVSICGKTKSKTKVEFVLTFDKPTPSQRSNGKYIIFQFWNMVGKMID